MNDQTEETFLARNRDEWRRWLTENHSTVQVVWLLFRKRHTGEPSIPYSHAVEEAICFGWIDGLIKAVDNDTYARRFTPRRRKSPWSALNRERALEMIRLGHMTDAGMDAVNGARESGTWYAVPRKEPLDIPQELIDVLDANPEAALFFSELAPSYRRHYMGWIASGKRPETRRKRAREAAVLLAKHMKLPMK